MTTVRVDGLEQLGNALKEFSTVIGRKYLKRATFAAAVEIEADAISRAPVKTGALRDHIAIFRRKSDANTVAYAIGVRGIRLSRKLKKLLRVVHMVNGGNRTAIAGDVYYWRYLEFGTAKMAAKPFLRPAFEAKKDSAIEIFRTILADGVQAAAAEVAK